MLERHSTQTRLSSERGEQLFGHRVLVAPQASSEQAQRLAQHLKQGGVGELLIYRSGEYQDGISLGVFANRSNAQRQSDKARRLGIETELVPVLRPIEAHYVSIRRDADTSIDLAPVRDAVKMDTLPMNAIDCRAI